MSEAVQFPKSLALDELSADVGSYEGGVGRLIAVARDGDFTVAEYEEGYAPDNSVELIDAGEDIPDGYDEVCRGACWNSGDEIECIAIRKTA